MITPADIERLAHLLAGDAPGWQARFSTMTGVSKGHVSNLLNGTRPITQIIAVKIIRAAQQQSAAFRERADEIDAALQQLPTMSEFAAMPRGDTQGDDE
jgi:limonene-1,2-epoxide hydrolase